jgi:hypothetical protein
MRLRKSDQRRYCELADRFTRQTGITPCTVDQVFRWAEAQGLLGPDLGKEPRAVMRRMEAAWRSDVVRDAQGRQVHVRFSVRVKE